MSTAASHKLDGRTARAQKKRAARREQILTSAKKVFATLGYHATSIADILKHAEISRGTFYLYFDGKDAIFRELLDGFVQQLMDAITVVDPNTDNATGQLVDNIRGVIDLLFDNQYLTIVLLREAVGLDAEVDKTLNRLNAFLHEMVMGALVNGAEWGLTRKVNERIVATAIIGSIKEVLYQYLVTDGVDIADRATIAGAIVDYSLRGLLPFGSSER